MKIKVLVMAVVKDKDRILLRKKPDGSPPYKQTWYIFGAELQADKTCEKVVQEALLQQANANVRMLETLGWDTEVKQDLDGETKRFVYLDALFEYIDGDIKPGDGIEKLEWANVGDLDAYDHVPPSQKLFKKLGYL